MNVDNLLFELIRVATGSQNSLSDVPAQEEWRHVYDAAYRQSLLGVCFYAVSKLPESMKPEGGLYVEWLSNAAQIQAQNEHVDEQTAEMWRKLKDAGLEAVVLKGQGIATLYSHSDFTGCTDNLSLADSTESTERGEGLASLRQPGDIDIWVKGGYQKVCDYVQSTHPTDDLAYHRFHYDAFEDTEVELHHRPTLMRNLLDDRKLAQWYNSFGADSFVYLEEKGFAVPPYQFNVIFILTHIYRHFLFEGVGLRQVMDYYFVLKSDEGSKKEYVAKILRALRLEKFARAVMWVMKTQFELEDDYLICESDEKEGKFLLNEIMMSGNFGQTDKRYQYKRFYNIRILSSRWSHLLLHYPSEVIWSPIWIVFHWFWKQSKKAEIHKMLTVKNSVS